MTLLLGLAIRSFAILAVGLLLSACLAKRSAALRHRVLAASLLSAALVLPFSLVLPEWNVTLPARAPLRISDAQPQRDSPLRPAVSSVDALAFAAAPQRRTPEAVIPDRRRMARRRPRRRRHADRGPGAGHSRCRPCLARRRQAMAPDPRRRRRRLRADAPNRDLADRFSRPARHVGDPAGRKCSCQTTPIPGRSIACTSSSATSWRTSVVTTGSCRLAPRRSARSSGSIRSRGWCARACAARASRPATTRCSVWMWAEASMPPT